MQKLCSAGKDETLTNEKELVNVFSKILMNIVERFCVTKPNNVTCEHKIENNKITIKVTCGSFGNPGIIAITKRNKIGKKTSEPETEATQQLIRY